MLAGWPIVTDNYVKITILISDDSSLGLEVIRGHVFIVFSWNNIHIIKTIYKGNCSKYNN